LLLARAKALHTAPIMEPSSSWSPPHPSQFRPMSWQGPTPPSLPTMRNMPRGVDDRTITPDPMTGALVASLDPAKIQEVAASQLVIIDGYYKGVLQEAQQLFRWALIAAGGGLVFLLAAVSLFVAQQPASISLMSLIGGGMVEGIAVLIFLLYGRAFRELEKFHARLDRTQQYLLANSVCEKLDVQLRQTAQAKLAQAIIDTLAPSEKKPS